MVDADDADDAIYPRCRAAFDDLQHTIARFGRAHFDRPTHIVET